MGEAETPTGSPMTTTSIPTTTGLDNLNNLHVSLQSKTQRRTHIVAYIDLVVSSFGVFISILSCILITTGLGSSFFNIDFTSQNVKFAILITVTALAHVSLSILLLVGAKQMKSLACKVWLSLNLTFFSIAVLVSLFTLFSSPILVLPISILVVYRGYTLWLVADLIMEIQRGYPL